MALTAGIGVFGGTFAPIHNAHLRLAIEVCEQIGLDRVLVVPCATPAHRAVPAVSAARRLRWVRLAAAGDPRLVADDRELHRGGPSYTYDTLAELRAELGAGIPLVLMIGEDAANGFHTWHRWREILDLAHLVFVERPFEPADPAAVLTAFLHDRQAPSAAALRTRPAGLCWRVTIPPLAISSTRVRRLLAAGRSVCGLVPDAVLQDFTDEDVRLLSHDQEPLAD
ncbi:MAG: nicotinate-nucleotide adenylyltransferase [Nevskiaceae bacterium]|nr:MAG: nicotinate-nucleotide adenylyltransferase [Nevskiaceae bacterium]TBR72768.1 MAG: nicotinate-nucleotide adenylyltransferase [Nevskiaceae bacterium]